MNKGIAADQFDLPILFCCHENLNFAARLITAQMAVSQKLMKPHTPPPIRLRSIDEFDYPLQDHQIAKFPADDRTQSKLLILKDRQLSQDWFFNLGQHLPQKALLVTNQTRVIKARLHFTNVNGASIEVFCLEPANVSFNHGHPMAATSPVMWNCLVGNSKRWKSGMLELSLPHPDGRMTLTAERLEKKNDHSLIRFRWDKADQTFGDVIALAGELPLPPYLHRKAEESDLIRYQTVFARDEGSVAAPTAGLHFTETLMHKLISEGHQFTHVTLHVGAGTFKPVSAQTIGEHAMHAEKIVVSKQTIQTLITQSDRSIIPVGTTSMRTLESLYWIGCELIKNPAKKEEFHIDQWHALENQAIDVPSDTALQAIIDFLNQTNQSFLEASTALMIAPGYRFRIANGLITNFHQPKSTLLLLVAALVGDTWRTAYDYALGSGFRFLSYGDSCLFLPE